MKLIFLFKHTSPTIYVGISDNGVSLYKINVFRFSLNTVRQYSTRTLFSIIRIIMILFFDI